MPYSYPLQPAYPVVKDSSGYLQGLHPVTIPYNWTTLSLGIHQGSLGAGTLKLILNICPTLSLIPRLLRSPYVVSRLITYFTSITLTPPPRRLRGSPTSELPYR